MQLLIIILTLLSLLLQFFSFCAAFPDDHFAISALFNKDNSNAELAFKYAVQWHNLYSNEVTFFEALVEKAPAKNIFATSKVVCNITKTKNGVIAIFGPKSPRTAGLIEHISKKLEIPLIHTSWQQSRDYPTITSLNFYPAADLLAQGFATIVRHLNWKTYAVVYQEDEALIKLKEILNITTVDDVPIIITQLKPGSNYRSIFKNLKESRTQRVILDCDTDDILDILQQAKDVGLLSFPMSYFLTSLDAHTLDYTVLNTTANITMARLFDPSNDNLVKSIQNWEVGEIRNGREVVVKPETVRTEAVLMIDAVNLLIETVNDLHKIKKVKPRAMSCDNSNTWKEGHRIATHMKKRKLERSITGPIGFDGFGRRTNFTLYVLELNTDKIKATWSPENGTRLNITISSAERRQLMLQSLQKQKVVVSTKFGDPYFNNNSKTSDSESEYEGYAVDLIEKIAQELNFTYKFYINDANGAYDENSQTWNGVIGDVVSGNAQLGICDLTVTHQRRKYVDFSNHFMTLGISILYKKPEVEATNMFAFMEPLTDDVWMYTATAYLGVTVALYLVARMAPGDWENPEPDNENPEELENIWSLENSLWLTMGSLLTIGCDILPRGISSRMVVAMWWFFSLLMTNSYTANMAAFLAKKRMTLTINSIDDLIAQNKIKFGTMINGSTYQFFKTSNYSKYIAVWKKMNNFKPSTFVKENWEGVKKVLNKNQNYAFVMESSSMEYEINRHQCELREIGGLLDSKGYGIAMPIDAPYRGEINDAILKLQESGFLQGLKDKWWKELNQGDTSCEGEEETGPSDGSLTLSNLGGVFLVLAIGVLIAFLISIVEFLWNVRNISVEEHITYWEALVIEFKFTVNFWITKKAARTCGSREPSESCNVADKVLQGTGSFFHLGGIFSKLRVSKKD